VTPVRRISVIVPMLNEARHVRELVADVAAQDFDGDVEVLVADGGSTDGSVDILTRAAKSAGIALEIVSNPVGWVSHGLNACVARATGDLVVRLDCHSRYPRDYLRRCAVAAEETDALAVGGIVVPHGRTPMERATACAMDSPFGGIGWMQGTSPAVRRDSDTVTYGAFRLRTFELAGLFDEALRQNQDDDFTFRIRRRGGRVVLDSAIQVYYTPRGSYRKILRQYFNYGFWKVAVMRKHRRMLSTRSIVPPMFVVSLAVLALLAVVSAAARWALIVELALYAGGAITFAVLSLRRRREDWRLLPRVAGVFPAFHSAYGLGVVYGTAKAVARATVGRPGGLAPALPPPDGSGSQ
jgi:succinoglycan biosynthesis protein ExoA